MIEKQVYKKTSNLFIFACFLMITFMMASKLVYTALMVEILDVFNMSEDVFATAPAIYYVIYAIVQLILASFLFKLNVKAYFVVTVGLSCVLTGLLALSDGINFFCILLGINGIFQAGIWSGCMYFLTKHLPSSMLPKANALMTCGFPTGTIVSYAISSACVGLGVWWLSFIVVALLFVVTLVFFVVVLNKLETLPKHVALMIDEEKRQKEGFSTVIVSKGQKLVAFNGKFAKALYYVLVGVICFMVYNVYSSIIDWIPKMLADVYKLDNSLAILFSVVVPAGVALGPIIMINLCEKFENYYSVSLIGCAILVLIGVAVIFGYALSIVVALVLLLAYSLVSRAVCSVYETVIVSKMKEEFNAGSFAAYTNAIASFGAAASPLIMGNVKVTYGWTITYGVLAVECVIMLLLIALLIAFFVRKSKQKTEKILSN